VLGAVPAPAEFLGLLPLFLCELPLVLPALRGPVPGLVVLPASFPRGFRVLGFGGRRSLPVTFGLRLREFLPGACGLLGSCAWPAGYREGVLERDSFRILSGGNLIGCADGKARRGSIPASVGRSIPLPIPLPQYRYYVLAGGSPAKNTISGAGMPAASL
jgi:hypothetical protein